MSETRPKRLTSEQKRALLAELLEDRRAQDASARPDYAPTLFDNRPVRSSAVRHWLESEQDTYARHVAPYRSFLYRRLRLDKSYVRGEGCHLFGAEGTAYADFIAQFGAVPFGHDPEPIWKAMEEAWRRRRPNLTIASISAVAGELAKRLLAIAPSGLAHVMFTNSGAEAVEAACKLARSRTGRLGILSARGGFHGLTLAGMSATDRDFFQRGFGAPVLGFNYVPFGDLAALEMVLAARPRHFAAFLVEVIQGEGGVNVAPPSYLAAARDLCHRFGTLMVVDEVQTGLGRTGTLFACDAEGTTPDVLILAKALGGGLMPIGACLYTRDAYTEQIDLRHGSTFAGNTLACCAALATLDELTRDDCRLVRHVAATGDRLKQQLQQLKKDYPQLVADVRGRGLLLGVEFDFNHIARTQDGFVSFLQQQDLLSLVATSYLLNVEHIRLAPFVTSANVLRIEPPLIADEALCTRLVGALRRLLQILQSGDAAALLGHFVGREEQRARPPSARADRKRVVSRRARERRAADKRFAFVVHMLKLEELPQLDPTLESFTDTELENLRASVADFVQPFAVDDIAVRGADGQVAEGEIILLPYVPSELLALSPDEAVGLVQAAVDLAIARGAGVVGLGGFSSIVVEGGRALAPRAGVTVTTGNSVTVWAAMRAVEATCAQHGLRFADCTVAVVGASGVIGYALSLLCAERAAELILIGNPGSGEAALTRLGKVAADCAAHVQRLAAAGAKFPAGSYAHRVADRDAVAHRGGDDVPTITIDTEVNAALPKAHVVFAATSATLPFISAGHLRTGAVVCDVSRPLNMPHDLAIQRRDLRRVSGGLMRAPHGSTLGSLEEFNQPDMLLACAAETIILALSEFQSSHLCGRLDLAVIERLGELATTLGFSVAT